MWSDSEPAGWGAHMPVCRARKTKCQDWNEKSVCNQPSVIPESVRQPWLQDKDALASGFYSKTFASLFYKLIEVRIRKKTSHRNVT